MPHLLFAVALLACAATFALIEIEIEGPDGWASGLPTWKVDNRLTRWLFGARPLTGYHLYVHIFILLLLHLPYALLLVPPTWSTELRIIAFLILFWILEDFLWFVFNPAYGVRGFTKARVWWHAPSWWGFMPREYWLCTPLGIGLYLVSWSV